MLGKNQVAFCQLLVKSCLFTALVSFTPGNTPAGRAVCILQMGTRSHREVIWFADVPTVQTQLGELHPFSTVSSQPTSAFLKPSLSVGQDCDLAFVTPPPLPWLGPMASYFIPLSFDCEHFQTQKSAKNFKANISIPTTRHLQ